MTEAAAWRPGSIQVTLTNLESILPSRHHFAEELPFPFRLSVAAIPLPTASRGFHGECLSIQEFWSCLG